MKVRYRCMSMRMFKIGDGNFSLWLIENMRQEATKIFT